MFPKTVGSWQPIRRRRLTTLSAALTVATALLLTACGANVSTTSQPEPTISIVPKPAKIELGTGTVALDGQTQIVTAGPAAESVGRSLSAAIQQATGWDWFNRSADPSSTVHLRVDAESEPDLGPEGYRLSAAGSEVTILASTANGLFYGTQTLRQLLPTQAYGSSGGAQGPWNVPVVTITDEPDVAYRSVMLDVSRHFFTVAEVKSLMDVMAMHKLNRLHLHLTDDEGWRIEIKKYPKLTSVGAWRGEGTALPPLQLDTAGFPLEDGKPAGALPLAPMEGTGKYGGFYTQDDIREIVSYAQDRFIEVIPEIEGPAHSEAAIKSYPELLTNPADQSTYKSVQGYTDNVLAAESPSTYVFMRNVLREVMELFPSKYIHIGGDEVPVGSWSDCKECAEVVKRQQLSEPEQLRSLYLSRLARFLQQNGRSPLVWDPYDEVGTNPGSSGIVSWQSIAAGVSTANAGQPTAFAPAQYVYLDARYGLSSPEIGLEWAGTTDTARTYSYQIPTSQLTDVGKQNILGITGAVFTELIWNEDRLQDMLLPRTSAVAELAWTDPNQRSWPDFASRMGRAHLDRLTEMGQKFHILAPQWRSTTDSAIELSSEFPGQTIRYSWNGEPTSTSSEYFEPIQPHPGKVLQAAAFDETGRRGTLLAVDID
jgi:hexosaminidase